MAGIFFWHNSQEISSKKVNKVFSSLEYKPGKFMQMGDWKAVVFPKSAYNIQNWLTVFDGAICGIGTFAYKGKIYDQALPLIANDIRNNDLDLSKFWGCFLVLAHVGGRCLLLRDGAGISRLYGFRDKPVYSSSFAGLLSCSTSKLNFDREAANELLTTGVLTSSQTLVKEIKCVNIGQGIEHIEVIESTTDHIAKPKSREDALIQQIKLAKGFFQKVKQDWFSYMPDSILDVGITGGMDSRMVAILAIDNEPHTVLHTHWRKERFADKDFRYAHIFAKSTGLPLHLKEVTSPKDMNQSQLEENFEKAYCLSDGVIRPGCYWDEAYSTSAYRLGLTKPPYLRLLGFGGEQYRNGERLPYRSRRSLKSWVRWEMIYRFAGRNFNQKEAARRIEKKIECNIIEKLGKVNLTLSNYKEYIRLILVPSYRSIQTNLENRIGFCLSPFQDTCLSIPAQMAIPFLGKSLNFQLNMIARISPKLGSIPNGYGFDFTQGEPWWSRTGSICWQFLPSCIKHPLYAAFHNFNRTDFIPQMEKKHKLIRELEEIVLQIDLPINFAKYRLVRSRSRLMLNLGYFLKRNEQYIRW